MNRSRLSTVLEAELRSAPVIEEFLLSGIVNVSAMATALKPLVVARLNREIPVTTIGMALRRYKSRSGDKLVNKKKFPRRITIRSIGSLSEIAFRIDEKGMRSLAKLSSRLARNKSTVFISGHGAYEISVLADKKLMPQIIAEMKGARPTSKIKDAACVSVDWPASTKDIAGIYYRVTRALARREISIQSFHTIGAEMMIVVRESDLSRAHATISQLLSNKEFE